MSKTRVYILFSLIVLSRSANFERHGKYEANSENYVPKYVTKDGENAGFELRSLDLEDKSASYEPISLDLEDKSASYEPRGLDLEDKSASYEPRGLEDETGIPIESSKEVTVFGYHMKIGVPRAIELLKSEGLETRIVGGSQVTTASVVPHQAGIVARLTSGWQSVCGGSLISNTRVLTAAHCWWDGENQANLFTIVLGSVTIFTGGTRIETSAVTVHPSWNARDITNDIAMVTISSVTYDNNIQAIRLPALTDVNLDFAGMTGTVSGFGRTSDTQTGSTMNLHQVSVNIIMNSVCQTSFQTVTLHSSHMCTSGTGNLGSCDGDSGGPLTTLYNNNRILVGVVSFGLSEGCQFGNPSVYTRVTALLSWINANM